MDADRSSVHMVLTLVALTLMFRLSTIDLVLEEVSQSTGSNFVVPEKGEKAIYRTSTAYIVFAARGEKYPRG